MSDLDGGRRTPGLAPCNCAGWCGAALLYNGGGYAQAVACREGWPAAMDRCACGATAVAAAYARFDAHEAQYFYCAACTPALADLPPDAPYIGTTPNRAHAHRAMQRALASGASPATPHGSSADGGGA